MSDVRKIKSGLVKFPFDQFIGEAGNIFFDPATGSLFLSDGVTPGGIPLGGGGGGGGGDVNKFGTPVNDQLAIWRNSTTVEGDTKLTWNGTTFAVTGNVTVSGTVNGRNISADGSKLDSIAPNATDDQTGPEITSSLDAHLGGTAWRTPGITNLSGFTTDNLAEGTVNLYFTNGRVSTVIQNSSIAALLDVDNNLINNLVEDSILIYNATSNIFVAESFLQVLDRLKAELEVQYDRLVDEAGVYTYVGEAEPGTLRDVTLWRIKRIYELPSGDLEILWANGTAAFDKIWDDRATYTF